MKRTAFSPHNEVYINHIKTDRKHNMSVQHYHDMHEVYFQLAGRRYLFYDNICYTLERGDMAIFKPFDIHYAESRESEYYERYVLNFREEGLLKILSGEEKFLLLEKLAPCVVHLSEEQTQILFDLFSRTERYSVQKKFLADKLLYSSILQLLVYAAECINDEAQLNGNKIAPQIMDALKFIGKNYMYQLSLDDIASAACMSKYHFCRKFKEVTGASVIEYLNNVRLTKVHSLLVDTKQNIDEIATNTGFSSPAQFSRIFKSVYGMSPRAFRKSQALN